MRTLCRQHIDETGHAFEEAAFAKAWDEKISSVDIPQDGKTILLVRC